MPRHAAGEPKRISVPAYLKPEELKKLDEARGSLGRSTWVRMVVTERLNALFPEHKQ